MLNRNRPNQDKKQDQNLHRNLNNRGKNLYYSTVRTHVLVEEDLEDPQASTSRGRYKRIASRHPEKKSTVSMKFKNMKFM